MENSSSQHTRVAAEGQFPSGRVGLSDTEIPVFVDPHCGSVRVPAGVGKQEVLKAGQHLRGRTENNKVELDSTVNMVLCVSAIMYHTSCKHHGSFGDSLSKDTKHQAQLHI